MSQQSSEPTLVTSNRIACDGGAAGSGHPRVWLTLPAATGVVTCPYCDAHFKLAEGVSAH